MVRVTEHSNGKAQVLGCLDDRLVVLPLLIKGLLLLGVVGALEKFDVVQIPNPTLTLLIQTEFFLDQVLSFAIPM